MWPRDIEEFPTRWALTTGDVTLDFTRDGERLYVLDEAGLTAWALGG
ncbi:hypothetical protein [Ruania halotolerans]|nr:hypothetical protein [Ruania halotolerans]UFU05867.1 hypothetical protein LQF10_15750 [Ruania halotolerans]